MQHSNWKIRPALRKVDGSNFGWHSLAELAEIIGLSPEQLWRDNFGWNNRPKMDIVCNGQVVSVYAHGSSTKIESPAKAHMPDGKEGFAFGSAEAFIRHLQVGDFLVPAGWSERVIDENSGPLSSISLNEENWLPGIWLKTYLEKYGCQDWHIFLLGANLVLNQVQVWELRNEGSTYVDWPSGGDHVLIQRLKEGLGAMSYNHGREMRHESEPEIKELLG